MFDQREDPNKMTRRQKRAFAEVEGEDPYAWLARTHRTLRYKDLPQLQMLRSGDRGQVRAIELLATLRLAKWTRTLAFGTFFLSACTILAAVIVVHG